MSSIFLDRLLGQSEFRATSIAGLPPRDPVLAEWFGSLTQTAAGVNVTPDNAMSCPPVAACVNLLSDTVGTVPLDLFKRTSDGAQERVSDHPIHRLVHDTPNSFQTSAEFRQHLMTHLCTYNNAYARIYSNGAGVPTSLEPQHPSMVTMYKRPGGGHFYRFMDGKGSYETLLPDEVLHLRRRPFTKDGLLGESIVSKNRETIGLAMATNEYLARFFTNNAMPKMGIKIPSGASIGEESVKRLRESWEDRHAGLENAHRLAIFYGGMEPVDLGMNHNDAQVVELYQQQIAEIARLWGIPLHLIGEHTKSTSWGTGIEQQSIGFIMYFVRPWYVTWEQALNRALLPPSMQGEYFFEFNADGLLRGDFKTRIEGYTMMVKWGLATPNEVRRLMNLPRIEGGDSRLQPLNMAPAEKVLDILLKPEGQAQRALAEIVTGAETADDTTN